MARILGAPVTVPAGKQAPRASKAVEVGTQLGLQFGYKMLHVRVLLHGQQLFHFHRAVAGNATEIVASEIDQHHVLGTLLFVGQQLLGKAAHLRRH